jgi:hypothetical protein
MRGSINIKSPDNTSKWQMGFNSVFKGLRNIEIINSTTRSHLVGYFCKIYIMMHGSMDIMLRSVETATSRIQKMTAAQKI